MRSLIENEAVTLLAALRLFQQKLDKNSHQIVAAPARFLTSEEIDALCDKIRVRGQIKVVEEGMQGR